jgi:hypothetical protein
MENFEQKSTLTQMIEKLKKENAENENNILTYDIEYRRLLQWLFEKNLEAESISDVWEGGHDSGSERAVFEREYQYEYRQRLSSLKKKYGMEKHGQGRISRENLAHASGK